MYIVFVFLYVELMATATVSSGNNLFVVVKLNVISKFSDAYENAKFLCDQYYLTSPGLVVEQCDGKCSI